MSRCRWIPNRLNSDVAAQILSILVERSRGLYVSLQARSWRCIASEAVSKGLERAVENADLRQQLSRHPRRIFSDSSAFC